MGSSSLKVVLGTSTFTGVGLLKDTEWGKIWHVCPCAVNLFVCTSILRVSSGCEGSSELSVAVIKCEIWTWPRWTHCGVSSVSGIEKGTEDEIAGRPVSVSEEAHRVYRRMLKELNSIRRFPSVSMVDRVTDLYWNGTNQISIRWKAKWTYRSCHLLTGIPFIWTSPSMAARSPATPR